MTGPSSGRPSGSPGKERVRAVIAPMRSQRQIDNNRVLALLGQIQEELGPRLAKSTVTVGEAIQAYQETQILTLKPSTQKARRKLLLVLERQIGDLLLVDLSHEVARRVRLSCGDKLGQARNLLVTLRSVVRYALEQQWLDHDPLQGLKLPRTRARERYLTPDELRRLLSTIDAMAALDSRCQVSADVIRTLALTGCRASEVVTLQRDDLDLAAHSIALRDSKVGPRRVPLGQQAVAFFGSLPNRHPVWLYPSPRGRHIATKSVWRLLKRASRACHFESVTLHTLRHTWATLAAQVGVPLHHVARVLGHSTTYTTARYCHAAQQDLWKACDVVANTWSEDQ